MSSKLKSKQQDTITHLLEQPKYKHQILTKMWSQTTSHSFCCLSSLLVGMQNGTATLKESSAVSNTTEHILTVQSNEPAPRYLLKDESMPGRIR